MNHGGLVYISVGDGHAKILILDVDIEHIISTGPLSANGLVLQDQGVDCSSSP